MGRERFLDTRASLKFYPQYNYDIAVADPFWYSRIMLEHFQKNAASVAVPTGVSSLDENTIRSKGRTVARSYMKSKPVPNGIRFYVVVSWNDAYLHSIRDNGSGNKTGTDPTVAYTSVFREMHGCLRKAVNDKVVVQGTE